MSSVKERVYNLRDNRIIKNLESININNFKSVSKSDIRYVLLKERLELSDIYIKDASVKICKTLKEFIDKRGYDYLLLYIPFKNEVDLSELFVYKNVFVPKIYKEKACDKSKMNFVKLSKDSNFTKNRYGILEPISNIELSKDDITENTIVIVPALAISTDRYRLGYGGGYYDEFLNGLDCFTIGVIFKDFMLKDLPVENHDQKLDIIITD